MAESAAEAGRVDLAVRCSRAADQPGFHQEHLRERRLRLTGVDLTLAGGHLRLAP